MSPFRYKIIRQIRERIGKYNPQKVFLFGSYARDEADDVSDVDIVIIKQTTETFFNRIRSVIKILQINRAIDILVYTPDEFENMIQRGNAFAEMILEEGVVIYEQ